MINVPHDTVHIQLDDSALELTAPCTLAALLQRLDRAPESVATALNGRFVSRESRAGTTLVDGDQVLLFQPIVGG